MKNKKIRNGLICSVAGLNLATLAFYVRVELSTYLYPEIDNPFMYDFLFQYAIIFPTFIILLLAGFVVNYYIINDLWETPKGRNIKQKPRLWQWIIAFSLGFGCLYGFWSATGNNTSYLLLKSTEGVTLALAYWAGSLIALTLLKQKEPDTQGTM